MPFEVNGTQVRSNIIIGQISAIVSLSWQYQADFPGFFSTDLVAGMFIQPGKLSLDRSIVMNCETIHRSLYPSNHSTVIK